MNKPAVAIVIVLLVIIGAVVAFTNKDVERNVVADDAMEGDAMEGEVMVRSEDAVVFTLTGENFKYVMDGEDNPTLTVNQGDLVRIEFSSTSGFHDWVVDEFDAATMRIRETDEATFVEFTADQVGTFEYYCSVGQHRANGMKGMLIVQ